MGAFVCSYLAYQRSMFFLAFRNSSFNVADINSGTWLFSGQKTSWHLPISIIFLKQLLITSSTLKYSSTFATQDGMGKYLTVEFSYEFNRFDFLVRTFWIFLVKPWLVMSLSPRLLKPRPGMNRRLSNGVLFKFWIISTLTSTNITNLIVPVLLELWVCHHIC